MSAHPLIRAVSAVALCAAGLGCANQSSMSPPSSSMQANHRQTSDAVVGTDLFVTLDTAIASYGARVGQTIVATVDAPVRGADGRVLIDAGSTLRGHVAAVETAPKARVAIKFDSIETVGGMRPISATVLDAGRFAVPGATEEDRKGYDALLFAPIGPLAATGGGPPTNEGTQPAPVYQLFVPPGSKLHLMLTADLHGR